jgi:hypothetical protein
MTLQPLESKHAWWQMGEFINYGSSDPDMINTDLQKKKKSMRPRGYKMLEHTFFRGNKYGACPQP